MADPSNVLALDDLKLMTGTRSARWSPRAEDIAALIGQDEPPRRRGRRGRSSEDEEEDDAVVADIRESAADAPVIKLVNSIIAQAVEDGASDIHFEPDGRDMRVRFRVDGVLARDDLDPAPHGRRASSRA